MLVIFIVNLKGGLGKLIIVLIFGIIFFWEGVKIIVFDVDLN